MGTPSLCSALGKCCRRISIFTVGEQLTRARDDWHRPSNNEKKPPDRPGGFFVAHYAWRLLPAHTTLETRRAVAHVWQADLADRADALFRHAVRGLVGRDVVAGG